MKPNLDFEVLDWADDAKTQVVAVRLYGTNHKGEQVSDIVRPPGLLTIDEVAGMVAKMNNGQFRPAS